MRATGIGLAVALLAASTGGAGAMDSHGGFRVKGVGTQPCSKYLTFSERDQLVTETWWAGFVTAMNIMKPDTYDYIGGVAPEKVNGMLRQRCEAHPNELIAAAAQDMARPQ
jgi:hypothetical protein